MKNKENLEMLDRLQNIVVELTGREDLVITPKTKINKDMGLSSLSLVEMVCAIEDEFDIEIPNSAIRKFKTVKDVMNFIEKNTNN